MPTHEKRKVARVPLHEQYRSLRFLETRPLVVKMLVRLLEKRWAKQEAESSASRKEKVQRLIAEQETCLTSVRAASYLRREDYMRDLSQITGELHRLRQELSALERGRLPGV